MAKVPTKAARGHAPKKTAAVREPFPKGQDGKTANDRLRDLLGERTGGQSWLARACSSLLGPKPNGEPSVVPQNIERFINDRDDFSRSHLIPSVAEVFEVRALWLQTGQLPKANDAERAVRRLVEEFSPRAAEMPLKRQ